MKKLLFFIVISFFIFPFIAVAKENDVIIESIELIEKSENTEELSTANIESNKVNVDLKLYDPGDYIEYNIKIKNVSEDEYKFDESKLKTSDEYVEYEFSYTESTNVLKPNEERTLKLKVTYKNKVPADKLENDAYSSNNKLVLTLIDGEIVPDIINPKTGVTNPIIYYIAGVVSVIGLLTIFKVNRKYKLLSLLVITTLFIPLYTLAENKVDVDINAKITIDGKEADLISGEEFNIKVKQVAGNDTSVDGRNTINDNITSIVYSNTEPPLSNKEQKNIVSTIDSKYPIYVWVDNGVLYWWSEDKSPNMNKDSSRMFKYFAGLLDIGGLSNYDSGLVENMYGIFSGGSVSPMAIESLKPLEKWNVSSVKDLSFAFSYNLGLTSLEGLENWDISNVETLYCTFSYLFNVKSLKPLSKWNTSKVKNMEWTFADYMEIETLEGLENWDTSNVTSLYGMFAIDSKPGSERKSKLKNIEALTNWDVSNVTNLASLLQSQFSLTNLKGLENWDTSNVTNMNYAFGNNNYQLNLTDVRAIKTWNTSNVTDFHNMFSYNSSLEEIDISNYSFGNAVKVANIFQYNNELKRIKTPKAYPTDVSIKIKLPGTFQDEDGNIYTQLDNTSPTQIWLTKVP